MEGFKNKDFADKKDQEIVFSKAIKAGKRIYYLDVKKNRKDELFLAITESKKIVSGTSEEPIVQFEKHKIFLYKEDFEKFMEGLNETISFIQEADNPHRQAESHDPTDIELGESLEVKIEDFE